MRAAFLTCSLCVLTAAQAIAQGPPAALPSATVPTAPAPTLPTASPPTLPESTLTDLTGIEGESTSRSGRPFGMVGPRTYASAEYMLFWYTPMNCPTLVNTTPSVLVNTTGAAAATTFPSLPKVHYDGVSGVRINAGVNFEKTGLDFSGFIIDQRTLTTSLANNGSPVFIGRPFIDSTSGANTTLNISSPNLYAGGVRSEITSQLYGMELNAKRSWYTLLADATYLIGGIRYFGLQDSISVNSLSVFPTGDSVAIQDSVRTQNSFYGTQIGFTSQIGGFGPGFGMSFTTKSGIGGVNQRVDLVGSNTILQNGALTLEPGGLFARGLNAGSFSRGQFAFTQDIDVKLTYNFTSAFQVSFGYSLFYITSVVRAGDQVNPFINPAQIRFTNGGAPTVVGPQPAFYWNAHSFVVQGLTFGARLAY